MRLDDGFSTIVEFDELPGLKMYEKTVTPPGVNAGGAIDTTTMRNTEVRTKSPKQLIDFSDMSLTVAYDTGIYANDQIIAVCGVNQLITITLPDGGTYEFWGWIDQFTPGELSEGNQPTATMTIILSNQDATDDNAEIKPVYTAPAP
jgi:hypothetical protein